MHYDCSSKNEEAQYPFAYSLKLPFDIMSKVMSALNKNETCEIEFDAGENERNGVFFHYMLLLIGFICGRC